MSEELVVLDNDHFLLFEFVVYNTARLSLAVMVDRLCTYASAVNSFGSLSLLAFFPLR